MNAIAKYGIVLLMAALASSAAFAQPSILTQGYDMTRSGANLSETALTPSNVSSATFGRLFSYPVDEGVLAQPLYMPNVSIAGATHNVVFVATMGNSVFAFDADNPTTSNTPLWSVSLGTPPPASKFGFQGGFNHVGIFSTPVIDPTSNTMYVASHLWSVANQSVTVLLHALDITTGDEKYGGPVQIAAPEFNADVNEQRPALLLLNGVVYIAFASHLDLQVNYATLAPEYYVGLVLAYDEHALTLDGSFAAEPATGRGGGIWQGGRGLASDGQYVYAMIGNAELASAPDYSESFVQLNPVTLAFASYFQDPDAHCMNKLDLDLGASGPQIIPGATTNLLVGGGKQGKVYTLSINPTEGLTPGSPPYFWGTVNHLTLPSDGGTCADHRPDGQGFIQGSETVFWNVPAPGNSYFYTFGNIDQLASWQVSGGTFTQTSADTPVDNYPNALALSANGGSNGILWTVTPEKTGSGIISAYNAVPTAAGHLTLLWNSTQVATRDLVGLMGRNSTPTVANGKVYISTESNQVVVYGLLPTTPSVGLTPTNPTMTFTALNPTSQFFHVNSIGGYTGSVSLAVTGLPPGVTYSLTHSTTKLTSTRPTISTELTISPASAVLPLNDNYTILLQATSSTGVISYAPIRLSLRTAKVTSTSAAGCNSSNQMSANMSWTSSGSSEPSIWIQDSTTPNFPGRLWIEPVPAVGTEQTPYSITSTQDSLYWIIDQSAGAPAIFDNAMNFTNLGLLYDCP
jgi:hypothetical protein